MIEINLLPAEYRPAEKTNVPLMATVAVGMFLVGAIILYGIRLNGHLASLNVTHNELSEKKAGLEAEAKKVQELEKDIAQQKARQDTIIEISQSKVMWSLKLQQFSQILSRFNTFWISRLGLKKSSRGGALDMAVSATGSDLSRVAQFRDALKNDPNFFYHFEDLQSAQVRISPLAKDLNAKEKMEFQMQLPLKSDDDGGKKGGRR